MAGSPYTDLNRPPLHETALARALVRPGALWTRVRVVAETGSTNADVATAARAGEPAGLVVVAEHQRTGRGRLDRTWSAPPRASITASLLVRPDGAVPPARLGWLPLLTGVALVEAVGRIAMVDAVVKWPNDLLVRSATGDDGEGYGKCAGVLAEAPVDGAVVIGFGLNVSQRIDELPAPASPGAYPATSLALSGAVGTDRDPLLRAVLRAFADWYGRFVDAGGDPDAAGLREAYRTACVTLGGEVEVAVPGGTSVRGRAVDVDREGRLVVATDTGERPLAAGDVLRVR